MTWQMTVCTQDRSISHYPRACLSFFSGPALFSTCSGSVPEPGSSSACVEVRGSERGRGSSNFSGKPTSVPEGGRASFKPTELCGRNSVGFQLPVSGGLDLSRETMRCCCVKEFCPQLNISVENRFPQPGEVHNDHWEAVLFFSTSTEMQLELKSTPIINYVERMRTVVKIKPTNLYFSLFLSSCFYMLQS